MIYNKVEIKITKINKRIVIYNSRRFVGANSNGIYPTGILNGVKAYMSQGLNQRLNISKNFLTTNSMFKKINELKASGEGLPNIMKAVAGGKNSLFEKEFSPTIATAIIDNGVKFPVGEGGFNQHYCFGFYDPRLNNRIWFSLTHDPNTGKYNYKYYYDDLGNRNRIPSEHISFKDINGDYIDQYMFTNAKIFGPNTVIMHGRFPLVGNQFFIDNEEFFFKFLVNYFTYIAGPNGLNYYEKVDAIGTVARIYSKTVKITNDYF